MTETKGTTRRALHIMVIPSWVWAVSALLSPYQPSLSFVGWHFTPQTFSSNWICSPEPKTIRTNSSLVISRQNKSVQSAMSSTNVLLLILSGFTYNIIAYIIIKSPCSSMTLGRHIEQRAGTKPLFLLTQQQIYEFDFRGCSLWARYPDLLTAYEKETRNLTSVTTRKTETTSMESDHS